MTDTEISFTCMSQEFQGRGARHEQLRQLVHNGLMRQMEDLQTRLERDEARLTEADQEMTGSPMRLVTVSDCALMSRTTKGR